MYQGFDHELARERVSQMREEVERNRLVSRSARDARSTDNSVVRKSRVSRGVALVIALFR